MSNRLAESGDESPHSKNETAVIYTFGGVPIAFCLWFSRLNKRLVGLINHQLKKVHST